MKLALSFFLIALLVSATLLSIIYVGNQSGNEGSREKFYFGVMHGSNSTTEAKLLIEKVKDDANLFVLGSWDININETSLNEVCNYAVDAGMSIIVYFDFLPLLLTRGFPPGLKPPKNGGVKNSLEFTFTMSREETRLIPTSGNQDIQPELLWQTQQTTVTLQTSL